MPHRALNVCAEDAGGLQVAVVAVLASPPTRRLAVCACAQSVSGSGRSESRGDPAPVERRQPRAVLRDLHQQTVPGHRELPHPLPPRAETEVDTEGREKSASTSEKFFETRNTNYRTD